MKNILLPRVIFGTSALGNLYVALNDNEKLAIVKECITHSSVPVVFDSAGKYGAGLALESLGKCLKQLEVKPDDVLISNKLGWLRTKLNTPEPTFEPGVWRNLEHDAVQKISYKGILECYEQGNSLLHGYEAQMVSVHDPDEYISQGHTPAAQDKLYNDILDAYWALGELKQQGKVKAIGIGSKDWRIIERITRDVDLDWVMIANSMTVYSHPAELVSFMEEMERKGVAIINSAVFNAGFLIGSDYYNYKLKSRESHPDLYKWRDSFFALCNAYDVKPAEVCVAFGLMAPGVKSIALSTSNPNRVKGNIDMAWAKIPGAFWDEMKLQGLLDINYKYL
ncbi:D-threo-aldose 1-dehydrogenase [Mucilaginibacter pineti]|uniref:D-threo-aldose 1-dehydrogenase n=1 Tax=Mucilaginibacter pineti TaxID=1391627 RepID=A0A1G6ZTP2_9SPHI|nr:aldo/keto reductase [Mucilaginibacter pineti]SDE06048.1 D-threo-aldose 1-dehydrogenase [Mucilaginibacter pineti]